MFIIVYQNSVILGPMVWNRYRFENVITEECDFSATLPNRNDELTLVTVSEDIKIYPVEGTPDPEFNKKIERLQGPFYTYTDTVALSSYVVESLPVDAVKNQLKSVLATERYRKETQGVKTTLQGTEITVDTGRETKNNLVQKYLLMGESDTVQWKFPESWLTLSKSEVGSLVSLADSHIQSQFDWEVTTLQEIETASTLQELDSIEILSDTNPFTGI